MQDISNVFFEYVFILEWENKQTLLDRNTWLATQTIKGKQRVNGSFGHVLFILKDRKSRGCLTTTSIIRISEQQVQQIFSV